MSDKKEELSDRELDALVAVEVMGWQRQDGYNYWMTFPAGGTFELHGLIATWSPSTDISAAMEVEDRIVDLGLQSAYADELTNIVSLEKGKTQLGAMRFDLIHATARQRCEAALATIERKRDAN